MSNVTQFGDIDVKLLPQMLEAVQKYHDAARNYRSYPRISYVDPISVVYAIMRKWDKVFHL